MPNEKPDPVDDAATKESGADGPHETKVIEGTAVEVAPTRGAGMGLATGFAGGLVGAGLVAAGFYFLVPGQPGALVSQVGTLDQRLAGLETELARAGAKATSDLDSLNSQVTALRADVVAQKAEAKLDALSKLVTGMQSDIDAVEGSLEATLGQLDPAALSVRLEGLDVTAASLLADIEALKVAQLPADLPERIGFVAQGVNAAAEQIHSLSQRMAVAEAAIARPDPTAEAALGIAIANLARTLDQGQPFVAELEAIVSLAPEDPAVAKLRPVAVKGVATFAKLDEQFGALVDPLLTAERQAGREGVWDKLVGNALSIVTVRRVGDVEGSSAEAIVARVEARLRDEDLAGAVAELKKLPDPALVVATPWLEAASLRVETDALVRALSARVLSHLAQGKG
ncbi:MAG: mitofilin family membrane protein [Parvibaculum sp.]